MKRLSNLLVVTIILSLFTIVSCEKEESNDSCNVSNPTEELAWLKTMINDFSDYEYIMSADYKGETVFCYGNCNPAANYIPAVYNCLGDVIGNANDIGDELSDFRLVWKHEDSKCNLEE